MDVSRSFEKQNTKRNSLCIHLYVFVNKYMVLLEFSVYI